MIDFDLTINRANTGACKWEDTKDAGSYEGYTPLTVADMEFAMPREITDALVRAARHGIAGYTCKDRAYLDAVKGFYLRNHSVSLEDDDIFNTNGVVHALGVAVRSLTKESDTVVIQPPVYPPFFDVVRKNGRIIAENALIKREDNSYVMDFEGLGKLFKSGARLMILCSPHNPVGRVWTESELKALSSLCIQYDVTVIADEIHSDIILSGHKHTSLCNISGMENRTITCTAMSKTFNAAGLSCSNIFIKDSELKKKYSAQLMAESVYCIPYFARAAAIAAFTQCDDYILALNSYIEGNIELCYDYFADNLPKVTPTHAEGTYLLWADFSAYGDDVCAKLRKANVALCNGSEFGTNGLGHARINVALPKTELMKALDRMKECLT